MINSADQGPAGQANRLGLGIDSARELEKRALEMQRAAQLGALHNGEKQAAEAFGYRQAKPIDRIASALERIAGALERL